MRQIILWAVIALLAAVGFYVRAWQCGELFPHASLAACLFWK